MGLSMIKVGADNSWLERLFHCAKIFVKNLQYCDINTATLCDKRINDSRPALLTLLCLQPNENVAHPMIEILISATVFVF